MTPLQMAQENNKMDMVKLLEERVRQQLVEVSESWMFCLFSSNEYENER